MEKNRFAEVAQAIDRDWMHRILQEMILIRSENPFDDPTREGYREQEMADYLAGHLSGFGLQVELREVRPGRPNVFGFMNGSRGQSALMLAGHMDTGPAPPDTRRHTRSRWRTEKCTAAGPAT